MCVTYSTCGCFCYGFERWMLCAPQYSEPSLLRCVSEIWAPVQKVSHTVSYVTYTIAFKDPANTLRTLRSVAKHLGIHVQGKQYEATMMLILHKDTKNRIGNLYCHCTCSQIKYVASILDALKPHR